MRKTTLLVCGAALAALTLTACSSGTSTTSTGGTSAAAENKPGKAAGFDSLKALSDAVAEKSDGAKSAHVVFTGEAAGEKIKGEGDFNFAGEKTAMQMTMATGEGEISMRFVDNIIYIKTPQEIQPGKPWLKLDLNDKDNPLAKMMGSSLSSMKNTDPSQTLKQLADSGQIKSVKDEEIDGKPVKHYSIIVDTAKLKDAQLGMDEAGIKALEKSGVKEMPVDVWINEENLPVRFVIDIPTAAGAGAGKVQADYSNWGKGVEVKAPDAAEVAELPGS
ncbi:Putative lipoprotein SCO4651 precursor [Alloactinosynnema sp. L-07]|uniref:hypothetical protein n=1 Tax=Alloactinosynnema sp. L-07 TaxID=1653480 RepID=UPI00065F093F|nr:hypothetical protein [Alloactinosynnema sp. L-07]CRK59696.1 Putative lipoprotein SCO4651 precursor [Alloactinosynnema sp. L-07]